MENINKIKSNRISKSKNVFLDKMFEETSKGMTENMAVTYTRSGSPLLDLFAQGGVTRDDQKRGLELFQKAFSEDREKAVRILFYLRDIRGGQGERTLFRNCLEWLGTVYPEVFEKIVEYVPEYGRWDDMFFNNKKCFDIISNQLKEDTRSENPSLLAKWLPTINASSPTTRKKARFMAEKLGVDEISYRKTLRKIRKQIKIVEELMSARNWKEINYSNVPSQAARIYRNAFKRHDKDRYNEFIDKAERGEEKIQSGTLYPYQIYETAQGDYSKTLEALWNQLPDYTQGKNAIVVADTSGSMLGRPMSVSVSLALYFAERNKGQFKDYFISFSERPKLHRIQGETLLDKMNSIKLGDVANTNIQAVFDLILNTAIQNNTSQEELPETIYIISDMEFDSACYGNFTNFQIIDAKYKQSGYKRPNLIFWNVDSRNDNLPVQKDKRGVTMISGLSPSIFKMVVEEKTPEEVMLDVINSKRYSNIKL
jgi:hypothetical protein